MTATVVTALGQTSTFAGASDAVDRAVAFFNNMGMTAQLIPVSHAFHSSFLEPAVPAVERLLAGEPDLAACSGEL